MIVCSTAHQRFDIYHREVLMLGLLTAYFKVFESQLSDEVNLRVFQCSFGIIIAAVLSFLYGVINQICL